MRPIDADALRQVLEVFTEKDTLGHTPLQLCDAMPTASPWHRVEDGLPKDGETVLIYCENTGGIVKSHYHEFMGSGGNQHYWFSGGTYHPKYWMPLPEPPKEDA